jgi:hypothetical protein
MKLRKLTVAGINEFAAYLGNLKVEPTLPPPMHLLTEAGASEPLAEVEMEQREFASRLEAARYLDKVLSATHLTQVERDAGLWAWLALFFFEQVCPPREGGKRKVLEIWRYLPAVGNYQKFFRHLLLGPFLILRAHEGDVARVAAILANRLHVTDDLMEQTAGYQDLITNPVVLGAQTRLYFDAEKGQLKEGARSKGAGSPRRLATVLRQFDLTFDLYGMTPTKLVSLLPAEFERFRN